MEGKKEWEKWRGKERGGRRRRKEEEVGRRGGRWRERGKGKCAGGMGRRGGEAWRRGGEEWKGGGEGWKEGEGKDVDLQDLCSDRVQPLPAWAHSLSQGAVVAMGTILPGGAHPGCSLMCVSPTPGSLQAGDSPGAWNR